MIRAKRGLLIALLMRGLCLGCGYGTHGTFIFRRLFFRLQPHALVDIGGGGVEPP